MLGFGLSAKPKSGYSSDRQANIQMALLQELGVTEFDVIAHDYGDTVAQELLARRNAQGHEFGLGRMLLLNGGLFPEQHRLLPILFNRFIGKYIKMLFWRVKRLVWTIKA